MSTTIPSLDRQPNESELEWKDRLTEHIQKHAPAEYRYYIEGGKLGTSWHRWIFPGIFGVISLFFILAGYMNSADIRTLNSSNAAEGEFVVERIQRSPRHDVFEENQPLVPVVNIRGESIIPLYSHNKGFETGKPVTLRYTQQGKVIASFMDDHGNIPPTSYVMMILSGLIFAGIGVVVGVFYRGAVDPKYVDKELAKLTAKQ